MRRNYKIVLVKESQQSTARTLEAYMHEPGWVRSTREAVDNGHRSNGAEKLKEMSDNQRSAHNESRSCFSK